MAKSIGSGHGGHRPGSGRPKGAKSKGPYKPHLEKVLAAGPGMLPKDVMLIVMRRHFKARRYDEAVAVAEKVAPFIHPRLTATALTVQPSIARQVFEMSGEELQDYVKELHELSGLAEQDLAKAKPKGSA
jgi:hypothetical protein